MEVPDKLSKIWSDGSPAIVVEARHHSRHSPHRTERCGENYASGGRLAGAAVRETTDHGQGDNVALLGWFNRTRLRTILVQRRVSEMVMIIAEVVREPPSQVVLVEHDHMVQTFAANGADQAFDERVLQGSAWRNKFLFQSEGKSPLHKFQTVNAIAIAQQIAGWNGVGKCLGQLLCGPGRRRRIGNIEMQDFAPLMRQDQEDMEDAEGGGRDDKEIHREEVLGVVVQEGLPGLVCAPGSGAILADGGIQNCNLEFGQFGLNSFATPGGIARPHAPNEVDEFTVSGGSAAAAPGFPAPEQAKAQPMPGD